MSDTAPMRLPDLAREACFRYGLASLMDALAEDFPQYANLFHEIAEKATDDARLLCGGRR